VLQRLVVIVVLVAVLGTACGSQPATCDEVADRTIELAQDLIDDLGREVPDQSPEDIIDRLRAGDDLPSISKFERRARALGDRAADLGCTQDQLQQALVARADRLTATTELGEFIIEGIKRGGL
jgi:hypothetical protein